MIIWDSFKLQNGSHTVTFSASGTITGLNGVSFNGTVTATTISANTISATGIGANNGNFNGNVTMRSAAAVAGTFDVSGVASFHNLVDFGSNVCFKSHINQTTGIATFNALVVNGTTTLNNVNFNQSVNLPSGSTINNQPIANILQPTLQPGVLVYGYDNDDIVIIPVAFSDTTSQSITVDVHATNSVSGQYHMTVTFSGVASNIQVTHTGDFPWGDGSFTGHDFHISDVRNQYSYSIAVQGSTHTISVASATYLSANLPATSLLSYVVNKDDKNFTIIPSPLSPRGSSLGISEFYGMVAYMIKTYQVNWMTYRDKDSNVYSWGLGIRSGSDINSVIAPDPLSTIYMRKDN